MAKTFGADVTNIGRFEFYERTPGLSHRQASEFNRISDGQNEMSEDFRLKCACLAALRVFIAKAPDGWNLDNLDIFFDQEDQGKALAVFAAMLKAEDTFQQGTKADAQAAGAQP